MCPYKAILLKGLGKKSASKISQIFTCFGGYFKVKTNVATFWVSVGKLGYFSLQHLVTLVDLTDILPSHNDSTQVSCDALDVTKCFIFHHIGT